MVLLWTGSEPGANVIRVSLAYYDCSEKNQ